MRAQFVYAWLALKGSHCASCKARTRRYILRSSSCLNMSANAKNEQVWGLQQGWGCYWGTACKQRRRADKGGRGLPPSDIPLVLLKCRWGLFGGEGERERASVYVCVHASTHADRATVAVAFVFVFNNKSSCDGTKIRNIIYIIVHYFTYIAIRLMSIHCNISSFSL